MIKAQVDMAKDEAIGPAHLEKEVSKKQRESFVDKVKRTVSGMKANMRRPNAGTRATESKNHEYKRDNTAIRARYLKEREKAFETMDMEAESMPEGVSEGESTEDQILDEENRAGLEEFDHLQKNGVAHIGEGTQFSDGGVAEGDGYLDEPSLEDLLRIEAEEKTQAEQLRKEREFELSKTGGGKRAGNQKVRGLR